MLLQGSYTKLLTRLFTRLLTKLLHERLLHKATHRAGALGSPERIGGAGAGGPPWRLCGERPGDDPGAEGPCRPVLAGRAQPGRRGARAAVGRRRPARRAGKVQRPAFNQKQQLFEERPCAGSRR